MKVRAPFSCSWWGGRPFSKTAVYDLYSYRLYRAFSFSQWGYFLECELPRLKGVNRATQPPAGKER